MYGTNNGRGFRVLQIPVNNGDSEKKCPSCEINPMSTAPWGLCRACTIEQYPNSSLGDTTGDTNDGTEGMDYGRTWSDYDY